MSAGTYKLAYPVTLGDAEPITELMLRRLNGNDLALVANAGDKRGEALRIMVCRMCAIPPSTFNALDAVDVAELAKVAEGFMGGAPQTGEA